MSVALERLSADPFATPNPFLVLGASPECDSAQLAAQAQKRRHRAADRAAEQHVRDALRALTSDGIERVGWALITPSGEAAREDASSLRAAERLGSLLFGTSPEGEVLPLMASVAVSLGWVDDGRNALPADELRWQHTTHLSAGRWQYWHALAIAFHAQAAALERVTGAQEALCSRGESTADASPLPCPFWAQAYRCWERVIDDEALWDALRRPLQGSAGWSEERYLELRAGARGALVRQVAARVEQACAARNRLRAARNVRVLETLATGSEFEGFHAAARDELEGLRAGLRARLLNFEDDPRARFAELVHGALLLSPQDESLLTSALRVMVLVNNEDQSAGRRPEEALEMARVVSLYARELDRRVFPDYPSADRLEVVGDPGFLNALEGLHYLLSEFGTPEEARRHEPYYAALSRHSEA